jgi:hypothetical protein
VAFLKARHAFRYALKRSSNPPPTSQREQNPPPRDLSCSSEWNKMKVFDPTPHSNIQTDLGLQPSQLCHALQDPHVNLHGRPTNGNLAEEAVAALWRHAPASSPAASRSFMNNVPINSIVWRSPNLSECRIVTPRCREELLTRILTERSYVTQVVSLEFPGTHHSQLLANRILDTMSTRMAVQPLLQTQGPFGVYPLRGVHDPSSDIVGPHAGVKHQQIM